MKLFKSQRRKQHEVAKRKNEFKEWNILKSNLMKQNWHPKKVMPPTTDAAEDQNVGGPALKHQEVDKMPGKVTPPQAQNVHCKWW